MTRFDVRISRQFPPDCFYDLSARRAASVISAHTGCPAQTAATLVRRADQEGGTRGNYRGITVDVTPVHTTYRGAND